MQLPISSLRSSALRIRPYDDYGAPTTCDDEQINVARARLSGLLIGLEIAALGDEVRTARPAIVGSHTLSSLYERAIRLNGGDAQRLDGDGLARAGLQMAHDLMIVEKTN